MEKQIKNWDKLKTDADRESVKLWSQITTVTINGDGRYMLDIIPHPATPGAYLYKTEQRHV